jgi:hypothetical protein
MKAVVEWIDDVLVSVWEILFELEYGADGHSGPGPPK